MTAGAMAQDVVCALRQEIAKIEGVQPQRLEGPAPANLDRTSTQNAPVLRQNGEPLPAGMRVGLPECFATGSKTFDVALGGGVPRAALTEIVALETRDGGAAAGFALALALRAALEAGHSGPVFWVGDRQAFHEAGFPHAPGLMSEFGSGFDRLLVATGARLTDTLWIAEEAARLGALGAVIVEIRGNPARLDLTATRRLHRRAVHAGRPVLLLRQAAHPEPTAAPCRFIAAPASAAPRSILGAPFAGSIGRPAFSITLSKTRQALQGTFQMEWNAHDCRFEDRYTQDSGALVSPLRQRSDFSAAARPVVALETFRRAG